MFVGELTVIRPYTLNWVGCCQVPHTMMSLTDVVHMLYAETSSEEHCTIDDQLRAFWLETLGIRDKENTLYDDFTGAVKFEDRGYDIPLPWREFHGPLPDNYQLSITSPEALLHRLEQDPAILKECDDIKPEIN